MTRPSLFLLLVFSPFLLSAQEFVVDDALTVTPAVTPGLVTHPVMAALDDEGNLFLAQNAGVNLNKEDLLKERPGFITRLVDTNHDGVYDKSTVFADNLTFPQGALWVYDSLYVMSPPSLWRFADEDGDGVAEVREELATGFDFRGNAADVHGPFLHPNGRLFWCHGRKGFAIPDNDTRQIMQSGKSAPIWSSQLSGGEVESFAGGGMDNPVELDFTDEGEILGTVNLFYGRPRGDTLTHWVYGGAYPRFDQGLVLEEFRKTGELLPPVYNFGHVAVSGMCRYRSGILQPEWSDGWLVTHFNTAEVTLTKTAPKGASYEAVETTTILKALKPDTHFTDVLEDHQGDLLVLDTGGWFRIGCPTSQIAKPDVTGNIFRISRKDRGPYQRPVYPDWKKLTSEQVSGYLDAEEDWCRDRAITELAVRGAPALPELDRILTSKTSTPIARINAVWTLSRMKFSESADLIYLDLTDNDPGVRQSAAHAVSATRSWQIVAANQPAERDIELERNRTITGALVALVRGDDPSVARAAATALGRMGEVRAVGALSGRLGRTEGDRFLEHALIYVAIISAIVGTLVLALVGVKLPGLEFNNQKAEAALRKELVLGEDQPERASPITLAELFVHVRQNYLLMYRHYLYFDLAKWSYLQLSSILPYVVLAPTIVSGAITLGIMQQILRAFGRVVESLQFLVMSWSSLVELASVYKRLNAFEQQILAIDEPEPAASS